MCLRLYRFLAGYKTVIPPKRHRAIGKETGLTNHIERLNNTFRQRVSRLVRASLSFSKKLNNHIGAIWYFIHGYNAELDRILASPLFPYNYHTSELSASHIIFGMSISRPCQTTNLERQI